MVHSASNLIQQTKHTCLSLLFPKMPLTGKGKKKATKIKKRGEMMTADKRCEPNFGSWEVNGQVVYNLAEQRALKPNPTGKEYNKRKANGRIEETFLVQLIEMN